ncbi:APC amino acid permease [Phanerochaete sordida]|uniref:APC amino acid permease n=1 Tax=Phanerochaete sordida TaxID=48140 RepID=A0A9P3G452_9APHY|nr:APC amino acid permease [Phanerochaete sordida]
MAEDTKSVETKDSVVLAELGYKQEFKRAFTPWESFGIAFSIIGLLPSMASTLSFSLSNGGPVSMVWGWAVVAFFVMFIALALGELASAAPTSGGLYFWTYKYSSPRWRKLTSWLVGYCNTMGNIAGVASIIWGCAVQLMAAVSIGSGMTFVPTNGQLFGTYAALLVLNGLIASTATRVLARLQGFYAILNLLLCLVIIIAVPSATPNEFHNTASYALGEFANLTSWPNGFAFILGFLTPLWTIGGFDGPIHISEEVSNARTAVPWAIVTAIGIAGVLGWVLNVVLAFYMGTDPESILSSPIGQPMAAIFFNCFGTKATLAIWSFVVIAQFMMGTSALVSTSRQTFAFARDGGLPFSRALYRMNAYTRTPVTCVWASVLVAFVLGLLAFAGPTAINAIFSLPVIGLYLAFMIPIIARFVGGRPWAAGPFNLGAWGLPVGIVAVVWQAFNIVVVSFPSEPSVTSDTMNYTAAVSGGWIILCLVYFFFPRYGGMYWFEGPRANVERMEASSESASVDEKGSVGVSH